MAGTGFIVDVQGLEEAQGRLLRMEAALQGEDLLESIGALVESQVRRRIQEDKSGPDGRDWPAWSERYARTRHANQSLLQSEGGLLDSIQYLVSGDELEVGSNLIYAATHQFGDQRKGWGKVTVTIPARPFLGLSDDDEEEIELLILDLLEDNA